MSPLASQAMRIAFVVAVLCSSGAAYAQTCQTAADCPARECFRANCLGNRTCQYVPQNNVACNDGNVCTTSDSCQGGVCLGIPANGIACNDANACTQTDTCLAGACVGSNPVTCTALDQCHVPGVCNPQTGVCSNPNAPDNTPCTDQNACTQADTCQAGACVGANPVTCTALDQCHVAGVCDPQTGVCSNPPAADDTPCTDQNACTQTDTCQAGLCVGDDPVVCTAQDQCHLAGVCDPLTGVCSNPEAPDNTPCTDQDACTQLDTCQAGVCQGNDPVVCTALDQCHVPGLCDPQTGACSNPPAADDTPCTDQNACTQTDTCQAGACVGANPVTCTGQGQCQAAGQCDPTTGLCSNQPVADGTPCNDQSACTTGETCVAGACVGTPFVCPPAMDVCRSAGVCDPQTGCAYAALPDGTPCNDQDVCTVGDACLNGACTGTAAPPANDGGLSYSTSASRSLGFFMVHERALEACLRDGDVRLGSLRISTMREALGLLWASPQSTSRGAPRSVHDREWLELARQTLVAVCNQRVFGAATVDPNLVGDSLATLATNSCATMKTLSGRLEQFNEVGAKRPLPPAFDAGPATPAHARSIARDPTRATEDTCKGDEP